MPECVKVAQHLTYTGGLIKRHLTDYFGTRQLAGNGDGWQVRSELDPRTAGGADRCDD